jgi:hypothetical protein
VKDEGAVQQDEAMKQHEGEEAQQDKVTEQSDVMRVEKWSGMAGLS